MSLTAIGAAGWAWVGYKWHDRALLVVNSAALVMILGGVFRISVG
jgi:multidrug transporter EmrE-like cation transporter